MVTNDTKEKKMVKKKKLIPKKRIKIGSEEEEEDDALCVICLEPFLQIQARPGLDTVHFM